MRRLVGESQYRNPTASASARSGYLVKVCLLVLAAVVFLVLLSPALPSTVWAGDDEEEENECLECHGDREVGTGKRGEQEIDLFVDAERYAASVHADLDCTDCHQDLDGTDYPHAEDPEPVNCAECHEDQGKLHKESLHGQALAKGDGMAPRCHDCHGNHHILSHETPGSPTHIMQIPQLCGQCHHQGSPVSRTHDIPQERIFENYSQSIHGDGLYRLGLSVTAVCTSCHTSHHILPHTDARSSIHPQNVAKTCFRCHTQIEQVHRKVIDGKVWKQDPERVPNCVECHSPHEIRKEEQRDTLRYEVLAGRCLKCHGDKSKVGTMTRDGKVVSLYVNDEIRSRGAHGKLGCAACHVEVVQPQAEEFHERPCDTIESKVDCGSCHEAEVADYEVSTHGTLHAAGDADAPICLDCHEKHNIIGKHVPTSPSFPQNVPGLCARCHQEGQKAARRIGDAASGIVRSYLMSIHGKGLRESGLVVTAVCTSCHTAHRELPPTDERSSVHPSNIAQTCGTCHHGIEEDFKKSVHWPANTDTERELPTCEDCHTSHSISRTDRDNFRFRMMDQCGRCHAGEAETFFDTYHGKVSLLGSARAAKCYDCHGTHGILPVSHPASTLSRDNVVETCGQCHEGAHRRFAGYLTHATHHDEEKYPWLFWTFWAMTALLLGTLALALVHTLAWLLRLWLSREDWRANKALAHLPGERLYRRFDRYQRTLHILMMLSFFTLATTGMALKFSYMGWAQAVQWVLGGAESLGVLHRVGAVLLIGVFIAHIVMVSRRKRRAGQSWKQLLTGPTSMLFNRDDLRQFIGSTKWFFGAGPRPKFGRYTYWEKFDYMAVFWGVAIIGSTGMILWFPELFTYVVPGWFVNVATIIHSDEALLAVAFIFTVHFFNTHFRPDKFPMDPVIFTGRVSLNELKYDKPAEYERLAESGEIESYMVQPFPRAAERGFRIFGYVALGFGLLLIGLIVYSMVFGYR